MKKKILALACAMIMVLGMSMSVCAAGSNNASDAATESTGEEDLAAPAYENPQTIYPSELPTIAANTTVTSGPEGASVSTVSVDSAKALINEAVATIGVGSYFVTIVDLNGGAGTYTLSCPSVLNGQDVKVLHQKSDGTIETITPDKVDGNLVTFTMTSTSPVAVVIDRATSPKTGDIIAIVVLIAAACAGGAVLAGRKAR